MSADLAYANAWLDRKRVAQEVHAMAKRVAQKAGEAREALRSPNGSRVEHYAASFADLMEREVNMMCGRFEFADRVLRWRREELTEHLGRIEPGFYTMYTGLGQLEELLEDFSHEARKRKGEAHDS